MIVSANRFLVSKEKKKMKTQFLPYQYLNKILKAWTTHYPAGFTKGASLIAGLLRSPPYLHLVIILHWFYVVASFSLIVFFSKVPIIVSLLDAPCEFKALLSWVLL